MNERLTARDLVLAVRYSQDVITAIETDSAGFFLWSRFSSTGIEVAEETTPSVARALSNVCKRLGIEVHKVRCFVYPDADMQAACLRIVDDMCGVRLSSSLVERLSSDELQFVIGHEIGHYLLGPLSKDPVSRSLEQFRQSRMREISCDRIGLIACEDAALALRAIMKVASGLSDEYLRFDAAAYLHNALINRHIHVDPARMFASHPPLAVRARALLWFDAFRQEFTPLTKDVPITRLRAIDERVDRDMARYVDRDEREFYSRLMLDLSKWVWSAAVVTSGRMTLASQNILTDKFSQLFVQQLKNRIEGADLEELKSWISGNVRDAYLALKQAYPSIADRGLLDDIKESEIALLSGDNSSLLRNFAWFTMEMGGGSAGD